MKECANCGFLNDYGACDCPHADKWYDCPIESKKPENKQEMKEYVAWLDKMESEEEGGQHMKCETCKYALKDYEEYYGTTRREYFVAGCDKGMDGTDCEEYKAESEDKE